MRITPQQALQRILATKGTGAFRVAKKPPTLLKTLRNKLFVFDDYGKTIVAPNRDDLPPILAEYGSGKETPELKWWLNEYADEMASAVDGRVMTKAPAKAPETIIEPLLGNIQWGQKAPFWNNLKYPLNGKTYYCYVGCLATAIAQVLFYWYTKGVKRGCPPTKAYTTATNKYSVKALPGIALFDWESMTDAPPITSKGKKAVALLCQYVSAALQMDYTPYRSAAQMAKAAPVLKDYFGMGDAKRLEARYMTAAKFKAEIIEELKKGHPVVMCGQSDESGCHAFVCDAYRSTDGLFHFNWGYNGSGNGWFALTALTPDGKDFTSRKNAIVGLTPHLLGDVNGDGRINISDVTKMINTANAGEYDRAADINSDGKVDREDINKEINVILGKEKL